MRVIRRACLRLITLCAMISITMGSVVEAQESVSMYNGSLLLSVTDLALQAGPVTLVVRRSLDPSQNSDAALGTSWQLYEGKTDTRVRWQRDDHGRLTRLEGPRGRSFEVTRNPQGYISRIQASTGDVVQYRYQGDQLIEASVNEGHATCYSYDAAKRLVRIERPISGAVILSYDDQGRVTSRRWANDFQEFYEYQDGAAPSIRHINSAGGLTLVKRGAEQGRIEVTDPDGNTTVTVNDDQGRPLTVTHPNGTQAKMVYDDLGRLMKVTGPDGRVLEYGYDADSRRISSMAQDGDSALIYEYDQAGRLVTMKRGVNTVLTLTYTSDGQVKTREGLGNPKQSLTYYPNGLLKSLADAMGQTTRYTYDARDNLIRVTDAAGQLTQWAYDEQNRMINRTDPGPAVTRYQYNRAGRLAGETDPLGNYTGYGYDAVGRMISRTDPLGRVTSFSYDASGHFTRVKDSAGHESRYEYDQNGRLVREVNPLGGMSRYRYDDQGQLASQTDASGRTWTYERSEDGLTTKVLGPDGSTQTIKMDPATRTRHVQDSTGQTETLQLDREGRPVQITASSSGSIKAHYNAQGQLAALDGEGISQIEFVRDALGRVIQERYESGVKIDYRYDALGQLVQWQDNLQGQQETRYYANGLMREQLDALGETWTYQYDGAGRLLQVTNPLQQATDYRYNVAGDLIKIQAPGGRTTALDYDEAGYLSEAHHPDGGVTRIKRDALGNALMVTDPQKQTVKNIYDSAGRLVRRVNARGQEISFRYDQAGRLSLKRLAGGTTLRYSYDGHGNLIKLDDGQFPVLLAYDSAGRVTRREYPAIKRVLTYQYDSLGQLERFSDSEGQSIAYQYDQWGRLISMTPKGDQPITFSYDGRDRLTQVTYSNGIRSLWQYDSVGRTTGVTYINARDQVVLNRGIVYDADGNPVRITEGGDKSTIYAYDPAGQLIQEKGPAGKAHYQYSAGGNRKTVVRGDQSATYQYEQGDRLVQAGDDRLSYDADGNLIERVGPAGTTRYQYNAENRLIRVIGADGKEVSFGYGPMGDRIWRQDTQGRTWFVTDSMNLLAELDEDLKTKATYLHGPGLDRPLQMQQGAETFEVLVDHLGSVLALTDVRGRIAANYRTDAFGRLVTDSKVTDNPLLFTARYYERQLGLYYVRARFYDPSLGRFLSKDPFRTCPELPVDLQLYAYVQNAPTRYRDPLGLFEDPMLNEQLANRGITEQQFTERLLNPEIRRLERTFGGDKGLMSRSEIRSFAQNTLRNRLSDKYLPEHMKGPEAIKVLRRDTAMSLKNLRNMRHSAPVRTSPSQVSNSASGPSDRVSVSQPQSSSSSIHQRTTRIVPRPPGVQSSSVNAPQSTTRISNRPPGPRPASLLNGGRSSVQKPGFAEINRPLSPTATSGLWGLRILSAIEMGNRIYHSKDPAKEAKSAAVKLSVGTAVAYGGAALVGSGPILVGGLTLSILSHVDDVAELPGEIAAWVQSGENETRANEGQQQFLSKITEATATLDTVQKNARAEVGDLQTKVHRLSETIRKAAEEAKSVGEQADGWAGAIILPPLAQLEAASDACHGLNEKFATLAQLKTEGPADQAGALEREIAKVQQEGKQLHQALATAVETRKRIADLADKAVRLRPHFNAQMAAFKEAKAEHAKAQEKWEKKINALKSHFKDAAEGPDKKAFLSKVHESLAFVQSIGSAFSIVGCQEMLDDGIALAVNAKLKTDNKVNVDYTTYAYSLEQCAEARPSVAAPAEPTTDPNENTGIDPNVPATPDPNEDSDSGWGEDGFGEEADNPVTLAETQDETPEGSPLDDGFGDESDEPDDEGETVTYFDRPWMPQSWRTSGDSRQVRVNIYCAGSRLGWAAALSRYTMGQADELIVEHLQASSIHIKGAHDNSFGPKRAWANWPRIAGKHESLGRRLLEKAGGPNGPNYRRSLSNSLKGQALNLARQIAYQGRLDDLKQMENCDSYAMRIGYYLAYASQALSYAAEAETNQMPQKEVRRFTSEGMSAASSAAYYLREFKKLKLISGFCVDLGNIANVFHKGISGGKSLPERVAATRKAWEDTLAALGGNGKSYPPHELAGEWAFSELKWNQVESPKWDSEIRPQLESWDPATAFRFTKQGNTYVGTLLKDPGSLPLWFSLWASNPKYHGHLFKPGKVLFRLEKVGQNHYRGQRFKAGAPGDQGLYPEPFEIVVKGQVARYGVGGIASSQLSASDSALMVRYDPPAPGTVVDIEAVGRYVFADLAQDRPRGASLEAPNVSKGVSGSQNYFVFFRRPIHLDYATDNNPGVGFRLNYRGKEKIFANFEQGLNNAHSPTLRHRAINAHNGQGQYSVKTNQHEDDNELELWLNMVWNSGDWTLTIRIGDYSKHRETMFGGQANMIRYAQSMLDKLAPRINNIPNTNLGAVQPPPENASPAEAPSGSSGGIDLLNIEVN